MWTKRTVVGLVWLCFEQYGSGGGGEKPLPRSTWIELRDVIPSLNMELQPNINVFFCLALVGLWVCGHLYFWQGIASGLIVLGFVEQFLSRHEEDQGVLRVLLKTEKF